MTKILLKNATVFPITSDPFPSGDVLIDNGKILKVGKIRIRNKCKNN